ncbi:unnamed protein product [Rotaria sordida]|uniref:Uncharacterized protein n=1 Tax=Rotaria sordida TaxID=392033 RepID=A0A815LMK3_9BILA|nr:unnamed protein product [Rotaria sordida]
MDASFSSRPIWWHHLIITVPRVIRRRMAYLMIDGGSNDDILSTDFLATWIPASADAITVSVRQVPNQPIRIWTDPSNNYLFEDPLLAWTWNKFHEENGSNPNVLLELPMTKAVVRAMDATQQFLQQQHMVVPEKFILAGHSKRGWTTWTTTAVEHTRVIAAIPLAMGLLNFRPNWKSHYRSLGGWSFAFADYYARNFSRYLDKSSYDKFTQIVDPYSYFSRFANVKLFLIQSTGDEFFMPDSEDFFWDELQSATSGGYLRYMPNTGHGLGGFHESLISFYLTIADQQILPSFKWERRLNQTHGKIRATIDFSAGKPKPTMVTAYHARTGDNSKRDFRQQKLDPNNGQMVPSSINWANTAVLLEVLEKH